MSFVLSLLALVPHIALMLVAAPTLAGVIDWFAARLTGRAGPPILLPWRDLLRLSRKTPAVIESVSVVSRLAPAVALGATLTAAILVPSFALGMALSALADLLVIVSLLIVARVAVALAALDSGNALPGLRQQSASALAVMAEPALMLTVVALALMGGSFNLDSVIAQQQQGTLLPAGASAVALAALLTLLVVDDPAPPEMLGGFDLAMMLMAAWLRRLVWIDLICALFLPLGIADAGAASLAWLTGLGVWAIKVAGFALALSGIRAFWGGVPRHALPSAVGVAALLALLATVMVLASVGPA